MHPNHLVNRICSHPPSKLIDFTQLMMCLQTWRWHYLNGYNTVYSGFEDPVADGTCESESANIFPEPNVISSDCLFCPTNNYKTKRFTIIEKLLKVSVVYSERRTFLVMNQMWGIFKDASDKIKNCYLILFINYLQLKRLANVRCNIYLKNNREIKSADLSIIKIIVRCHLSLFHPTNYQKINNRHSK